MPLPFRASPSSKHTRLFSQSKRRTPRPLFTQTITPADSEEEISPPFAPTTSVQPTESPQSCTTWGHDVIQQFDIVMDMGSPKHPPTPQHFDMDSMMLSPKASPCSLLPCQVDSLTVHDSLTGGRLPTPIYGHFQQSMDAKADIVPGDVQPTESLDKDYETHMRARRLPTPISEDEAMDVFGSLHPDHSSETPDIPYHRLRQPARFAPPLPYQSPRRSKPLFSMGFRADCEMCRNRVPGHYNHIFRG